MSASLPVITYKPGWAFSWSQNEEHTFLHISCSAPEKALDSRTGEERQPYSITLICPMPFTATWLLWELAEMEEHERREWLKLDGEAPFDPHRQLDDLNAVIDQHHRDFCAVDRLIRDAEADGTDVNRIYLRALVRPC